MTNNRISIRAVALALLLFAGAIAGRSALAAGDVHLTHIHGLSYSDDGARLLIPSHHGMALFENGKWRKAEGPPHDFMGFSATREALYSSGHPAPGSGLTNPFGLVKSTDGGKSWNKLGLEGESDFHLVATGYATQMVYVVNHAKNSRMPTGGLYYTGDDGRQWTLAHGRQLVGEPRSLAAHPQDARLVAAGTDSGLYLSRNGGNDFERLRVGAPILGLAFDLDGKHLWFSSHSDKAMLATIALAPKGAKPQTMPIPALTQDAVAYIAQNPARRDEFAIATFKRHVFVSTDRGKNWRAIARDGATLP